jgi:hypothetical protein
VLFAHGTTGNITDLAGSLTSFCYRHAVAVMVFDYRGYGRSEGTPSEQGLCDDARAARSWLARLTGVDEQDIVLMGRSLGGAVMVDLAAKDGARGLILESTFTSLSDVARRYVPLFPSSVLITDRFDSLSKIKSYRGPLLMSHGDADQVIPFEQGVRLFHAANQPKRFVTIAGADHQDSPSEDYHMVLDEFIAGLPPGKSITVPANIGFTQNREANNEPWHTPE